MICIFDLDDTLIHENFEDHDGIFLFEETVSILTYLVNNDYTLAIATHNSNVYEILKKNDIEHFFDPDLVIGFDDVSKKPHLNMIMHIANVEPQDCIYFDDLLFHVQEAKELGMHSYCVDFIHGLKLKDVKNIVHLQYITHYATARTGKK
jgi:FMN phosphatase YigB (HAD superfamily)